MTDTIANKVEAAFMALPACKRRRVWTYSANSDQAGRVVVNDDVCECKECTPQRTEIARA